MNTLHIFNGLLADIRDITKCPLDAPYITRDWVLIEGPKLDKSLLMYLEDSGNPVPDFPEWLMPLWNLFISSNRDASILKYIRQILVFCYKVEYTPTHEQIKEAQASFIETDRITGCWPRPLYDRDGLPTDPVLRRSRQIVAKIIGSIDWLRIRPKHGPGAVFPPRKPCHKSRFDTIYSSIDRYYPWCDNFCALPNHWEEQIVRNQGGLYLKDDIVSKLIAVPKDSRGPRLICVHPAEAIWIQQGQRHALETAIKSSKAAKYINFTDQTINGRLALEASASQKWVTLDLKEASDRISCHLVECLFGTYAYDIISSTRSSYVRLLDGRDHKLNKWAPMGNCLTFPVQSLIYYSLVCASIYVNHGVICDDVYVFGDDIIFPSKYYQGAIRGLTMSGAVPNMGKTFMRGFFRESCGVDAFNGVDVTPLRLRKENINSYSDAYSLLTLAKRLRIGGFMTCSSLIYSAISERWGYLPKSNNPDAQGFVEYVNVDFGRLLCMEPSLRYRKDVHTWATRCRLVRNSISGISIGDWYHLQDSLMRLESYDSGYISERGTEYPVPYREQLSYGWSNCVERP